MLCNIKLASRYESYVNFNCDLQKTLNSLNVLSSTKSSLFPSKTVQFQLDVIFDYKKLGGNYHRIINLRKVDVCKVMDNIDNFPMFKGVVNWLNLTFPKLVHKCPFTVIIFKIKVRVKFNLCLIRISNA